MSNLQDAVEHTIRKRRLFGHGKRIMVAVSGGVDSMVLLYLLHMLATKHGWKLVVAHFNHQLRGRSSDADERLVRKTALALGLRFSAGRGRVKTLAKKQGQSIEMVARDLRHEFLAGTAMRLRIRTVALAHHSDDQVELFFLRLLRGAGGEGIAGMKWSSRSPTNSAIRLVRPLLDASREELEQFACENRIRFREDSSNASHKFLRNRIRHELLPLLRRSFQPALNTIVLRLMEIVGEEAQFADGAARAWLKNRSPSFGELATAIARRVLHLQLQEHNLAPDFDLIESLRLFPAKPMAFDPMRRVVRDAAGRVSVSSLSCARFRRDRRTIDLNGKTGRQRFGGLHFRWRIVNRRGPLPPPHVTGSEVFDADRIGGRIVLRHWQAGDRFQPIGLRSSLKLQDWFTNRKVPRRRRHKLVLATTEYGEVFWIEDQRISEDFKLRPDTKRRLIWRWQKP